MITSKKKSLVEMHFSFIFLLALSPIEYLHVKFHCATVVIEQQEQPLMQIVIFYKTGPAAHEEHLSIAIIVYLHLIWRSFTLLFSKDGFMKLLAIH
jgi:hypothetical protein